jgi:acyl-coenzyme A thioesterase PaaI-like protein
MKWMLFWFFNIWPPFLGAGITVRNIASDLLSMETRLKSRPWTSTLLKAQFGGSIFAMTDPIYAAILSVALGKKYAVWDVSAKVSFMKPGRSFLTARFAVSKDEISSLLNELEGKNKIIWSRTIEVLDSNDVVVASVEKSIYIRKLRG